MYVVGESGTVRTSELMDTLEADALLMTVFFKYLLPSSILTRETDSLGLHLTKLGFVQQAGALA